MSFGIDLRARSRKAGGWFRKAPQPKELGERLGWLVRRLGKGVELLRAGRKDDRFVAELQLHPAAPRVVASIEPDGELLVRAPTARIGPGYHVDVIARFAAILDELEFSWVVPPETFALARVQAEMCAWLAGELRAGKTRIALPADRRFVVDAPVLTPLGPRDAAWRDAVLADPARAADAFAWWDTGKGRAARSRALLAMWLEIAWREPIAEEERDALGELDRELSAAHAADPALELPWPDWAHALDLLGREGDHEAKVRARAGERGATIGYRRHPLEVELPGGWHAVLPGSFLGGFKEDGAVYWGTDGDRSVELTSFTADDAGDSAALLAVAPEHHPVIASRSDGELRGRAEAFDDEHGVRVVVGLAAQAPHVAILTCKGDEAWALETWRSLRR